MAKLRSVGAFILNLLVAGIVPAIVPGIINRFYFPATVTGVYVEQTIISASVAFLLGFLAYYKFKSTTARWICIAGIVLWIIRFLLGVPLNAMQAAISVAIGFIALRTVFYSIGALAASAFGPKTAGIPTETELPPSA